MRKLALAVAILVCLSILAGCSQHLGNFTALSSSTYRIENVKAENLVARSVSGTDCCWNILGIPTCWMPKLDAAVNNALSRNNGDFMQNARLDYTWWHIAFVGQTCFKATGDVYQTNK